MPYFSSRRSTRTGPDSYRYDSDPFVSPHSPPSIFHPHTHFFTEIHTARHSTTPATGKPVGGVYANTATSTLARGGRCEDMIVTSAVIAVAAIVGGVVTIVGGVEVGLVGLDLGGGFGGG
jgi:hypothetical protein